MKGNLAEQVDQQVDRLMQGQASGEAGHGILALASELRFLPSDIFRKELKAELLENVGEAESANLSAYRASNAAAVSFAMLPTLSRGSLRTLPADPRSLAFSFLSHAAAVVLIASGIWTAHSIGPRTAFVDHSLTFPLPAGSENTHGGGSGGDRSPIQASRGTPPKFSSEQMAPPAIVVRTDPAKLQVEPTVLGPPQLKLPQSNRVGDLLSNNVTIPSNGTGHDGGMGSHAGTGIGDGEKGAGVGVGREAGYGGGPYAPGNGVSAPRAIFDPEPEYSEEARLVKHQGVVVLSVVVDPSGRPRDIRIARSLGMGLDEKAVAAVEKWKFAPGMRDGIPVSVQVNIEVNFRLY